MSILTSSKILEEIKSGKIKIDPFDESAIGPGSVDLTLDNTFRVFKKVEKPVEVNNEANYENITELVTVENGILIMPGETILGITKETITVAEDLCGWLEGRSRFARMGLAVHITAGFMQPGVDNKQVLEMTNFGAAPLFLKVGTKICQFIFERCEGKAKYSGGFAEQKTP
jgi:dCTP deaminase